MKMLKGKKGQNAMVAVIVLMVMLFIFGVVYLSLFPLWQMLENYLTPLLTGQWLDTLENWRKAIVLGPFAGFILALIWVIVEIVRDRQAPPQNYY